MKHVEQDKRQDAETLEHLLGVVIENREKRCAEVRARALQDAKGITRQAYARGRARLHRHILALREKYRIRVTSAVARNITLLRQQHQQENRAKLDATWPELKKSMQALWDAPESRHKWIDAAIACASSSLLQKHWHIEYPGSLDAEQVKDLKHRFAHSGVKLAKLVERADIEAGIRIISHGTVVDSTIEGLLRQRGRIEAGLIATMNKQV